MAVETRARRVRTSDVAGIGACARFRRRLPRLRCRGASRRNCSLLSRFMRCAILPLPAPFSKLSTGATSSSARSARFQLSMVNAFGFARLTASFPPPSGTATSRPSSETRTSGVRTSVSVSRPASATGTASSAQPGRGHAGDHQRDGEQHQRMRRDESDRVDRRSIGKPASTRRSSPTGPSPITSKNGASSPNGIASEPATAKGMTTSETIGIDGEIGEQAERRDALEMVDAE